MELNLEKNTITLYGKSYKYDLFLNKLASLPGEDLYQFITNRGIALPRKMNCMALVSVLNEKIKYLHSKSLSKDNFARLEYYKDFGESALVAIFSDICNDDDFYKYRYNLINLILINHDKLSLNDGELQYLRSIKKSGIESFPDYENYISASCLEQDGTFDGVEIEVLKNSLLHAATVNGIIELGKKYGIEIPEHLTREEYYDFIVYYLDKKGKYTEEIEAELKNMTLAGLTTFSRRNGVPLQPTLTKEDYITYLFYYLDGCDIVTTNITEIEKTDIYDPVNFSFDLSQISIFGEDKEAKRIVSFDGDDDPEYVEKINKIIEDANKPEVEHVEEILAAPLRPGEKTMDDDSGDIKLEEFELELEAQEKAQEEEAKKLEEEKALEDEEIMKLIEKDKEEEEKEPEVVEEKIDITKVVKNDEYASKRLKELKHGNRKMIVITITASIVVLVLGFVIYALVR